MSSARFDPEELLERVETALEATRAVYASFEDDPLSGADIALHRALEERLVADGDGWLSKETADDTTRLDRDVVWLVAPLDGTLDLAKGLTGFCTSIAAVVDGIPIVGGVINLDADLEIMGGLGLGLTCNGTPVERRRSPVGEDTRVLASRTEVGQRRWEMVEAAGIEVEPMASVAYRMARVAAGLDWATWTPVPKHEWDVAGGVALLKAAGGTAVGLDGRELTFNRADPILDGVIAVPPGFEVHLDTVLALARQQAEA